MIANFAAVLTTLTYNLSPISLVEFFVGQIKIELLISQSFFGLWIGSICILLEDVVDLATHVVKMLFHFSRLFTKMTNWNAPLI